MSEQYFPDINRAALIVKLKKPFIDWLVYTSKEYDGPEHEMKPEEVETEGFDSRHVYLIPAYEENEKYEKFLKKHYVDIFEHELGGWYTDPKKLGTAPLVSQRLDNNVYNSLIYL
jgi:hypothetical protein